MLATVLRMGLHADYLALIEKRNFAALSEMKQSRGIAEQLLAKHPQCYDAYLARGRRELHVEFEAGSGAMAVSGRRRPDG